MVEDLHGYLRREDDKRVDTDDIAELLGEEGKLGEAAHGEYAAENEFTTAMGRRGEIRPNVVDGFAFGEWEGVETLERITR